MSFNLISNKYIAVEIVKHQRSHLSHERLKKICTDFLESITVIPNTIIDELNEDLSNDVQCIVINESEITKIDFKNIEIKWIIYVLHTLGNQIEYFQNESQNEMTSMSTNWLLPHVDFHGLWESLVFDIKIKQNLLKYISTMMVFSLRGVDSNIISSNRVVLLHGPPGTGKTSLCKALAQKLSIQLKNNYPYSQFVEINSHSLFSKWFSESGKLVTKMFSKIHELVENPRVFVCILIDEIESLAHTRKLSMSGNEPSDAIRVVNAVLTQIDQIKKYPNVLILATSNMTEAIDLALIDRADIKQYIGLPSSQAIYQIYCSCLKELMKKSIILPEIKTLPLSLNDVGNDSVASNIYEKLLQISTLSNGFTGRSLRKVPFIAHALFAKSETVTIDEFFNALIMAIDFLKLERQNLEFNN